MSIPVLLVPTQPLNTFIEHTLVCKLIEVQGVSHGALPLAEARLRGRRAHLQPGVLWLFRAVCRRIRISVQSLLITSYLNGSAPSANSLLYFLFLMLVKVQDGAKARFHMLKSA